MTFFVLTFFSGTIATAVKQLCERAVEVDATNVDWLFVLPLYHFLIGTSKPFMAPEYSPEKIEFNIGLLNIGWKIPQGLA